VLYRAIAERPHGIGPRSRVKSYRLKLLTRAAKRESQRRMNGD
jgi:hypothetical protein